MDSASALPNLCMSVSFYTHVHPLSHCSQQVYLGLLSLITITVRRPWVAIVNSQLVFILLATWFLFMYRDVWPLATYTLQPIDLNEGWLLWVKISVLSITAVGIPLLMPRRYIPVNPKVRVPVSLSSNQILIYRKGTCCRTKSRTNCIAAFSSAIHIPGPDYL